MINITHEIRQMIDWGALFVANHSGGKDSQAMLIKLREIIPAGQLVVIHASLGHVEWPGALEKAQEQAHADRLPFIIARAEKNLLGMVERRHATRPDVPSWPSSSTRQCTSDLKRGPIEREIRRYIRGRGFWRIVNCMGIRAEESNPRAKLAPWRLNVRNSVAGREWYDWLPIHSMKVGEVFATIRDAGQEPHWAYAAGNERLSCVFCIMASGRDIANGAKHNPDLLAQYLKLEAQTGYTMHMSRKPLSQLITEATYQPASGAETEPCDLFSEAV